MKDCGADNERSLPSRRYCRRGIGPGTNSALACETFWTVAGGETGIYSLAGLGSAEVFSSLLESLLPPSVALESCIGPIQGDLVCFVSKSRVTAEERGISETRYGLPGRAAALVTAFPAVIAPAVSLSLPAAYVYLLLSLFGRPLGILAAALPTLFQIPAS